MRALVVWFFLFCQAAMLSAQPFKQAQWISIANGSSVQVPYFIRDFKIVKPVQSAQLMVTAHGIYQAMLNGKKVTSAVFEPGFSSYDRLLYYREFEVGRLLRKGTNRFRIIVAGGWYSGVFGGLMKPANYGTDKSALVSLNIKYTDGSDQVICSDGNWVTGEGAVRQADFYSGELADTRMTVRGLIPVTIPDPPVHRLLKAKAPPVMPQEQFRPLHIRQQGRDTFLVDFGQNLAGWVELSAKGASGDTVSVTHAEMLDDKGDLWTKNLRSAKAVDTYVLSGKMQRLSPHFTYHGFRYARVTGIRPTFKNCRAVAVYSKLRVTGSFSCSDPNINRLVNNIRWSMNSNFVSIPTDCPQRSERLGWTGDAQVFARTAGMFKEIYAFYRSYLESLRADQGVNGGVPAVIPDINRHRDSIKGGIAGWGDAVTIIPWTLYELYGRKEILQENYTAMKAWVDFVDRASGGSHLWRAGGYGDWYAPGDSTNIPFIDQCFFAHSADILARTALLLGNRGDHLKYSTLADQVKTAFRQVYGNFGNRSTSTQTAYTLALAFDMLPVPGRRALADSLAGKISKNSNKLSTGFLGTPYLLPVLSKFGHDDVAFRLLFRDDCPSWLYPVKKGATTIWEKWDAIRPDGGLQPASFNHYAYGAVGQWLFEEVAGISLLSPGYQKMLIAPHPSQRLRWVKCTRKISKGTVRVNWKNAAGIFSLRVSIPAGTSAQVLLPGSSRSLKAGPGYHVYKMKLQV